MSKTEIGNHPCLDEAEKLLEIIDAYIDVSIDGFDLTLLQLKALQRRADKTLTEIRELSFQSYIEDKLHNKKLSLNRRIESLQHHTGFTLSRKRKSLPTLDLDALIQQIEELKEKKKVA
ncbi:MAG: hypothetical protein R3B60_01710 [Candidatus Paceibacterota bacterium]